MDQRAETQAYRALLDSRVAPGSPGEARDYAPDAPLSLAQSLRLANQYNETLARAGEDYLQAIIAHKRTLAGFLPTVDFVPALAFRDKVAPGRASTFDASFQGGYSNFNAWKQLAEAAQAAATIEQRRELLLDAQTQLLIDAARTYYFALLSEERVRVLNVSLEVQEERVRDVSAQAQVGLVRALDKDQARAQAASTRAQLEQARGDVANARTALAFLIGVPEVKGPLTDGYTPPSGDPDPIDTWLNSALLRRSDLAAAERAVEAERQGAQAAFAQYYPSLTINLDAFVYRETEPVSTLYSGLIRANLPIFTGNQIHQDVRKAWSRFRQAKLDEARTRRKVDSDVRVAYQNVLTTRARLVELRTQVGAAQDAFDQSVDLLRVGLATNLERLIAQGTLLQSQLDLLTEELQFKTSLLTLRRTAGLHPLDELAPPPDAANPPAGGARAETR